MYPLFSYNISARQHWYCTSRCLTIWDWCDSCFKHANLSGPTNGPLGSLACCCYPSVFNRVYTIRVGSCSRSFSYSVSLCLETVSYIHNCVCLSRTLFLAYSLCLLGVTRRPHKFSGLALLHPIHPLVYDRLNSLCIKTQIFPIAYYFIQTTELRPHSILVTHLLFIPS